MYDVLKYVFHTCMRVFLIYMCVPCVLGKRANATGMRGTFLGPSIKQSKTTAPVVLLRSIATVSYGNKYIHVLYAVICSVFSTCTDIYIRQIIYCIWVEEVTHGL